MMQKRERERMKPTPDLSPRLSSDKWPVPVERGHLNTLVADWDESKMLSKQPFSICSLIGCQEVRASKEGSHWMKRMDVFLAGSPKQTI